MTIEGSDEVPLSRRADSGAGGDLHGQSIGHPSVVDHLVHVPRGLDETHVGKEEGDALVEGLGGSCRRVCVREG